MKQLLLLVVFALTLEPSTHAQGFGERPRLPGPGAFSKPDMSAVTIVGISSLSVGTPLIIVGFALSQTGGRGKPNPDAPYVFGTGIGLLIAGAGLAIGGGIHDATRRHRRSWSLVATKSNEVGFAYNFK